MQLGLITRKNATTPDPNGYAPTDSSNYTITASAKRLLGEGTRDEKDWTADHAGYHFGVYTNGKLDSSYSSIPAARREAHKLAGQGKDVHVKDVDDLSRSYWHERDLKESMARQVSPDDLHVGDTLIDGSVVDKLYRNPGTLIVGKFRTISRNGSLRILTVHPDRLLMVKNDVVKESSEHVSNHVVGDTLPYVTNNGNLGVAKLHQKVPNGEEWRVSEKKGTFTPLDTKT